MQMTIPEYARAIQHAREEAHEIRKALILSCFGESGKYVYAEDTEGTEHRIHSVRRKGIYVQARALATGKWFNITWWSER